MDRHIHEPFLKRPFDLLLAGIGILVSLPLWFLIICLIWLEDGRPIFFRQPRIGRNEKSFNVLKFRSMVKDSNKVEVQATKGDPRITRVGRILRETALDELPQIWNIFIGHMSFVGPRAQPEMERVKVKGIEKDVYIKQVPGYELRHLVRPGLTGVAQLHAAREVPHRHKFKYDLIYVKKVVNNASLHCWDRNPSQGRIGGRIRLFASAVAGDIRMFCFDLGLIVRSIRITFKGKWEV